MPVSDAPPAPLFERVYEHLMDEAALLDARLYREWHATLDPAIHYSAYAHLVRLQGEEVPLGPPLFLENHASLRTRCEQLTTPGLSVSDNPPAPTRHFVTNVRLRPSDTPGTCRVDSYVLVYRTRGTDLPPFFLSALREDEFTVTPDALRLRRRRVRCDDAVITSRNLSFFL